jgi:hypothetical protein
VTKGLRESHYEELRNLDSSSNIIRVIKSERMRLAGYLPLMGEMRYTYTILDGISEATDLAED